MAFISDPTLVSTLRPNPDEVECIFDHPLKAIHTGIVEGELAENLHVSDTNWWPGPTEFHVSNYQMVRTPQLMTVPRGRYRLDGVIQDACESHQL